MKTLAIYALEVLACSGVLLAAYAILLERHVRFGWCRAFLLVLFFSVLKQIDTLALLLVRLLLPF